MDYYLKIGENTDRIDTMYMDDLDSEYLFLRKVQLLMMKYTGEDFDEQVGEIEGYFFDFSMAIEQEYDEEEIIGILDDRLPELPGLYSFIYCRSEELKKSVMMLFIFQRWI